MAPARTGNIDPARESSFQAWIVREARCQGWRAFHAFDMRNSAAGFPDLVLVRAERMIVVEVKTDAGRVSDAQREWLGALGLVDGCTAYVWRPRDRHLISGLLA